MSLSHFSARKDPEGFDMALVALDPPPVKVDEKQDRGSKSSKKKRKSSSSKRSKRSRSRKASKPKSSKPRSPSCRSTAAEPEPAAVDKGEIIKSFGEAYQHLIRALPVSLWPQSERHGSHSYAVNLCCKYFSQDSKTPCKSG